MATFGLPVEEVLRPELGPSRAALRRVSRFKRCDFCGGKSRIIGHGQEGTHVADRDQRSQAADATARH
jgi:hypothetical protein